MAVPSDGILRGQRVELFVHAAQVLLGDVVAHDDNVIVIKDQKGGYHPVLWKQVERLKFVNDTWK